MRTDESIARRKTVLKVLFVSLIILDAFAVLHFSLDLATEEEITNPGDKEDTNNKDKYKYIQTIDRLEDAFVKEDKR